MASLPPISIIPAFSPGPHITFLLLVGKVFNHFFVDLYEQCSLHITEKIPNSRMFGILPRIFLIKLYSVFVKLWS